MMPAGSDLLSVGRITGTHGVRGMVRVHLYAGDDSALQALDTCILRHRDGRQQTLALARLQGHGKKTLLSLKGYATISEVESLVGGELLVRRDQLPETDDGEYYWADLVGLRVVTEQGAVLGTLEEIIETGSNDVYVVRGGEKEILVPALADVVLNIDLEKGVMTVEPPDGLLDL